MKNLILFLMCLCTTFSISKLYSQTGIFRVDGKYKAIQIGYNDYRYLTFGYDNLENGHQKGHWAIEHWKDYGGLNFWRPSPLWNAGNFFFFIHDNGQIGIGMDPDENDWTNVLQIKGKVKADGYNTWSDEKLKENIEPFGDALLKLRKLNAVSYNYKTDVPYYEKLEKLEGIDEEKRKTIENDDPTLHEAFKEDKRIGFLAQNVEEVLPEIVETDSKGLKSIDYDDLIPVAIQAIKEQQKQIEQLQVELENIKALNNLVNAPDNLGIKATLYQNDPNPFNQSTTITYNIETDFDAAKLVIYDFWKNIIATQAINEIGEGKYTLSTNTLNAGTYYYSLVVNGVVVDTRLMFIVK